MADAVNVTLTEDDSPSRAWQITSDGAALNLAAATVVAVIKATPSVEDNATSGVYTLTAGSGLTIENAATGRVKLDIPSEVMASPSTWFYKIRVAIGSNAETAVWGWITVSDA